MTEISPIRLCRLPDLGVIAVRGADAATFLQGQLTCDVRRVTPQRSCLGAWCLPNGRVIATFRLLGDGDDGFLMVLSDDLRETVLQRLSKFVLRSQVGLSDADGVWQIAGLSGAELKTFLPSVALALPEDDGAVYVGETARVVRLPGEPARALLLSQAQPAWWKKLAVGDGDAWRSADIDHGLPSISAPFSEQFIPQMLNLDLLGAVSFEKGCYTGQEIIARTHYLGAPKRRLYRYLAIDGQAVPLFAVENGEMDEPGPCDVAPGAALYAAGQTEAVGVVVNAAKGRLLAVVNCEYGDQPLQLSR